MALFYHIETFGCQMNVADSGDLSRALEGWGFVRANGPAEADWIIVNTCTVRQHAEQRAVSYLGRLRKWKEERPSRRLIMAGCAAERLAKDIPSRFPFVDLVAGARSSDKYAELLSGLLPPEMRLVVPSADLDAPSPEEGVTTHVSIMRGCNFSCGYCVVPAVRGRERYRPANDIVNEVSRRARAGTPEVLLLGQTVNSYRPAEGGPVRDFADLLRAVHALPQARRIRFMSPHPAFLSDRLIDAIAECPRVCRHIHLPVQSGSDKMLKAMRRGHTRDEYLKRLAKLKQAVPGISVTTDFIVGYPGETDADFFETLLLIQAADFHGAYCFKYSPRPGTPAAEGIDDVPEAVKEERHARLLALAESAARQKAAAARGGRMEVLVETCRSEHDGFLCRGRTDANRWMLFTSASLLKPGDLVSAVVTSVEGGTLKGEAVREPCRAR